LRASGFFTGAWRADDDFSKGDHMGYCREHYGRRPFAAASSVQACCAEYMVKNERQTLRAYSPAVITEGGRIVWHAGQTALGDKDGHDLTGNFDGQAPEAFGHIDLTLKKAGGSLANLVP
jgi:enamine deaminase RidA (YjgF/YER057c/UK114 family)